MLSLNMIKSLNLLYQQEKIFQKSKLVVCFILFVYFHLISYLNVGILQRIPQIFIVDTITYYIIIYNIVILYYNIKKRS